MSFHSEEIDDIYVEQIEVQPETISEEEYHYRQCMQAQACDDPIQCRQYCKKECTSPNNPYSNPAMCEKICLKQCENPKTCVSFARSRCNAEYVQLPICASLCEAKDKQTRTQFMNASMPLLKRNDYVCESGRDNDCLDFDNHRNEWFIRSRENYDTTSSSPLSISTTTMSPLSSTTISPLSTTTVSPLSSTMAPMLPSSSWTTTTSTAPISAYAITSTSSPTTPSSVSSVHTTNKHLLYIILGGVLLGIIIILIILFLIRIWWKPKQIQQQKQIQQKQIQQKQIQQKQIQQKQIQQKQQKTTPTPSIPSIPSTPSTPSTPTPTPTPPTPPTPSTPPTPISLLTSNAIQKQQSQKRGAFNVTTTNAADSNNVDSYVWNALIPAGKFGTVPSNPQAI